MPEETGAERPGQNRESGVYLAKEPSIEYLDRLVLRHLDEMGIRERILL